MQTETVHGTYWCPGATITITWDGTTVDTAVVNMNGNFNATFKIPKNATPGPHTVTAMGSAFQCTAPGSVSNTVTVSAGSTSATDLVLPGASDPLQTVPAASHGYTFRFADLGIALCFVGFVLMLTHKKIWVSHPRRTPVLVRMMHNLRRPPASSRGRSR
jgi:hypothetical protein